MIRVRPLPAVPPGEVRRVEAEPPIAVFHTEGGEVYADDGKSTFALRTGHVDAPPAKKPVRTHAVVVEDDRAYVELSDETPNLPPGVSWGSMS
ncbi:bifunctional 3-phenylpropionate/cinnamic acid dioxygenase ferredoxin subunit [Isoptericola croceus]|uniref:bifunctional 3-phenylpropionate/cinnamic acid dioxygenase ferredoxin subunit n=1 Tax=Isoptericola croceus TaxID=3031406 RepID=UPI0023F6CF85|nr:bifunctional 3-phenylpropionate/cinnamic acid dioxygenase ferredoxin subunit [Isoptericola croceus]